MKFWTIREVVQLERMASEGYDRQQIADALKRTYSAVKIKSNKLGIKIKGKSIYNDRIFAVYKNDDLIFTGTVDEIAEFKNIKKSSVTFLLREQYLNRTSENAIRLVEITDEEEL